jgi:poly(hydroxyalkanoate) depolymerase family esterase
VLYAQAASPSGCFRWFEPAHASRGEGETASLVAGVDWVLQRYAVDRRRVFVTGLSAGAAMGAALLASSPDVFSAGALFAGVPAGCASTSAEGAKCMLGVDLTPDAWAQRATSRWPVTASGAPRVQVWTGSLDTTVAPTMARELVEQWTRLNGLAATPTRLESAGRVASEEFSDARGLRVQSVVVSGLGHAVPIARGCGSSGPFVVDAEVCGASEAARFFGLLTEEVQGDVVEVLDAGVEASDAGVDAGVTATCRESVATPTWHLWLRHGEVCGFFRSLVCGVGSGELLGALASAVPVTAHAVNGEWRAGPCR